MPEPTTHYHAMSGSHGCMPDNNEVHATADSALDSLCSLFELSRRRRAELKRNWSIDLKPGDGAEYAEITECDEPDCMDETGGY
jgi:hypothetical protein